VGYIEDYVVVYKVADEGIVAFGKVESDWDQSVEDIVGFGSLGDAFDLGALLWLLLKYKARSFYRQVSFFFLLCDRSSKFFLLRILLVPYIC